MYPLTIKLNSNMEMDIHIDDLSAYEYQIFVMSIFLFPSLGMDRSYPNFSTGSCCCFTYYVVNGVQKTWHVRPGWNYCWYMCCWIITRPSTRMSELGWTAGRVGSAYFRCKMFIFIRTRWAPSMLGQC